MSLPLPLAILFAITFAVWAGAVAREKNLGFWSYALLGLLLPLIGVVAAYAALPRRSMPWRA